MTTELARIASMDPVFSLATVLPSGPDQLILEFDAASVVTVSRDAWEQLVISLDGAIRREPQPAIWLQQYSRRIQLGCAMAADR